MFMLLWISALSVLALLGVREIRPAVDFQHPAAGEAVWAMPWLMAVNWNGDEGGKKSGGK